MIADRLWWAVAAYLWGELTPAELARALPDGWDLDQGASQEERRRVLRLMGHLAELDRGDLTERSLRMLVAGLAIEMTLEMGTWGGFTQQEHIVFHGAGTQAVESLRSDSRLVMTARPAFA